MVPSILLFGKSGSGRSTIANIILRNEVFVVGDGVSQTTTTCEQHHNDNYEITELIGLGETRSGRVPHSVALKHNKEYISKNNNKTYNYLCYVAEAGRFDQGDYTYWKEFTTLFRGHQANFVIVFTKRTGWLDNNIDNISSYIPELRKIQVVEVDIQNEQSIDNLRAIFISDTKPITLQNYSIFVRYKITLITTLLIVVAIVLGITLGVTLSTTNKHASSPAPSPIHSPPTPPLPLPSPPLPPSSPLPPPPPPPSSPPPPPPPHPPRLSPPPLPPPPLPPSSPLPPPPPIRRLRHLA